MATIYRSFSREPGSILSGPLAGTPLLQKGRRSFCRRLRGCSVRGYVKDLFTHHTPPLRAERGGEGGDLFLFVSSLASPCLVGSLRFQQDATRQALEQPCHQPELPMDRQGARGFAHRELSKQKMADLRLDGLTNGTNNVRGGRRKSAVAHSLAPG